MGPNGAKKPGPVPKMPKPKGDRYCVPNGPQWQVTPASAAKEEVWDEVAKSLKLRLSHKDGAVEMTVK